MSHTHTESRSPMSHISIHPSLHPFTHLFIHLLIYPSIHQGCRYMLWQIKQAQTEQSPSYHHIISLIISSWSQHPYTCIDDSNALPHLAPPAYSPLPPPVHRPHPPLRYQDSSQPLCSAVSLSCRPRRMNSHLHWAINCRRWLMNAAMKRQLIIFD